MSGTFVPLFGPVPGGPEMIVILLIAILLFGANKIPKLARSTGEAMGEFKKGRQEVEQELEELQEGSSTEESSMGTGTGGESLETSESSATESSATESSATESSATETSSSSSESGSGN